MKAEHSEIRCPRCQALIPAEAPPGLCPRCALAAVAAPTDATSEAGPWPRVVPPALAVVAAAFPQLEILRLVGVGGMGVVYQARQPKLDRTVALKLLPQSLSADPAFAERFQREARFLARLNHPNIVTVFDFGESGGFCYLLLEYVEGVNLRQAMQAGRFSAAEALALVPRICDALQYAHSQGVLHRDIKPENILLDARGAVKIADFGIAKMVHEPGAKRTDVTLTESGARLGTPHYMAPEQIENPATVDHRADIYSLGVVFYELLTGELPLGRFAAPSTKTPLDARVDARVDEIVFRALAKEKELRQQSAGEVKTQVEGLGSGSVGLRENAGFAGETRRQTLPSRPTTGDSRSASSPGQWFRWCAWVWLLAAIILSFYRGDTYSAHAFLASPPNISTPATTYLPKAARAFYELDPAVRRDIDPTLIPDQNQLAIVGRSQSNPQELAERVNAAAEALRKQPDCEGLIVVNPAIPSNQPISASWSTYLVAGMLGFAALFAMGRWLPDFLRTGTASSATPVNLLLHWLKWSLVGTVSLLISAFLAYWQADLLRHAFPGFNVGLLSGIIPMCVGVLLGYRIVNDFAAIRSTSPSHGPGRFLVTALIGLGFVPLVILLLAIIAFAFPKQDRQQELGRWRFSSAPVTPVVVTRNQATLVRTRAQVSLNEGRLGWEIRAASPSIIRYTINQKTGLLPLQPGSDGRGYVAEISGFAATNTAPNQADFSISVRSGVDHRDVQFTEPAHGVDLLEAFGLLAADNQNLEFDHDYILAYTGLQKIGIRLIADSAGAALQLHAQPGQQSRSDTAPYSGGKPTQNPAEFAPDLFAETPLTLSNRVAAIRQRLRLDTARDRAGKLRTHFQVVPVRRQLSASNLVTHWEVHAGFPSTMKLRLQNQELVAPLQQSLDASEYGAQVMLIANSIEQPHGVEFRVSLHQDSPRDGFVITETGDPATLLLRTFESSERPGWFPYGTSHELARAGTQPIRMSLELNHGPGTNAATGTPTPP